MTWQKNGIATAGIGKRRIALGGLKITDQVDAQSLNATTAVEAGWMQAIHLLVAANLSADTNLDYTYLRELSREGHLFVTLWDNAGHAWRWSNEWLDGGQYLWEQRLESLPAIRFQARDQGGYITLQWGQIRVLPGSFTDDLGVVLPAPKEVFLKAEWGHSDSQGLLVFEGEAYLRQETEEILAYDLFEREFKQEALEWGISHQASFLITAMADQGGGVVRCTTGWAHDFTPGEKVLLQPVDNASDFANQGLYEVLAVDGVAATWFEVALANFVGYTPNSAECGKDLVAIPLVVGTVEHILPLRTGFGDAQGEWKYYRPGFAGTIGNGVTLFDDSVAVNGNFEADQVGQRYLQVSPALSLFGRCSASGQGSLANLADLFAWGAARLGLTLVNPHGALVPVNHVFEEQILVVDLLDRVAGYCGYAFTIQGGHLHLFDRAQFNQDLGVRGTGDVFNTQMEYDMPIRLHKAKWRSNLPGKLRNDGVTTIPTLVTEERLVSLAGGSPLGAERDYAVFDQTRTAVRQRLEALKAEAEKPKLRLRIPLEGLPAIGDRLRYQDEDMNYQMTALEMEVNFEDESIEIIGRAEAL